MTNWPGIAQALLDLLTTCEWTGYLNDGAAEGCPVCAQTSEQGHAEDCALGAQLTALTGY